jgi:hypothetical protein
VAAVNCFADGGTNAHLILQAWKNSGSDNIKRQPLSPPELDRHDIRFIGRLPSEAPSPVWNKANATDLFNLREHNPPVNYRRTKSLAANGWHNVWGEKIVEDL